MSTYTNPAKYISMQQREIKDLAGKKLFLNPWTVQSIVYKIIENHMIINDPKASGFTFDQRYSPDKKQSSIDLEIAFNWKPDTASKRPAVFISRGHAEVSYPTMSGRIGLDAKESNEAKLAIVKLPLTVSVVAAPVGFVEQLAEYVKQPLMYYAQTIQCDFKFLRFRLVSISKPQIYSDNKDNFIVELGLQIEYNDNWVIHGDDLKLKTFSTTIFDAVLNQPLDNQ